jgi:hypothetical protein
MHQTFSKDPRYRRLPSNRIPVIGSASYWLASDHLLIVDVIGILERYRRIRLDDIEVVLVQPNHLRRIFAGILSAFLLLLLPAAFGFIVYLARSNNDSDFLPLLFLLSALALVPIALLLWILVPGPFCQTRLRTSVQDIRLPGLFRLKVAREFVAALRIAAPVTPQPASSDAPATPDSTPAA